MLRKTPLVRIFRTIHRSGRMTFINTLLQRGVLSWIRKRNRFNGFGARNKTAEAVKTHSPHLYTPLKQGVNEKTANKLELICSTISRCHRTPRRFLERGIYSASTPDGPVVPICFTPFAVGNLKRTEVRAPLGATASHYEISRLALAFLIILVIVGLVPALCAQSTAPARPSPSLRHTIDLSGEWEFRMDPFDVGKTERWYDKTASFDRKINVPGAWNAQGAGYEDEKLLRQYEERFVNGKNLLGVDRESEKLYHVFPGPAWYRRVVTIPSEWQGEVCWLKFAGVHRRAEVWVNGNFAGSHFSYLTPFRFDIGNWVKPGQEAVIAVRVDARRNKEIDPLMGCLDTLDFLYLTWGGIYRTVALEETALTWIEDIFAVPHVSDNTVELRLLTAGDRTRELQAVAEVLDPQGVAVARVTAKILAGAAETTLPVHLPDAKLWSPSRPDLYTARVALMESGVAIDSRSIRFGMRELRAEKGKFMLNGKPIFLRGYGDDCIFPNTIAPPANREEYVRRLSTARDYGFNYARHHSWFPPEEYLEVADELGIMVQPEFPAAYAWDLATTPQEKQFVAEQWESVIRLYRNHPSIVTWCLGNELYNSFDSAPQLYRRAKQLDPTRLVIDSDGCNFKHQERETLDFLVVQFGEGNSCGFQDAKYSFPSNLAKPVIAHEMGYFVTLPDLTQIDLFGKGLRPYWLFQARELALKNGMTDQYRRWVELSNRLQAACLKSNLEATRRSNLSGYSQWLFQDYPNCAEGVVDMFFRPKGISAAEFRKFNAPTVLLLDAPRRNYYFGETADLKLLASRYEDDSSQGAVLRWELRADTDILTSGKKGGLTVTSEGLQTLMDFPLVMPQRPQAEKLTLAVELKDSVGSVVNEWNFWVFPKERQEQVGKTMVIGEPKTLQKLYPSAKTEGPDAISPDVDLLITSRLRTETLDYLAKGGRVMLLALDGIFSTEPTNYRLSSWDGGGPSGTEIEREHGALRDMPNEGWGDLQFFHLIQGSKPIFLDSLPAKIHPLFRCIDRPQRLSNRAYLFEVAVGRGKLLVTGFNFARAIEIEDPAATYFLSRLVDYILGPECKPAEILPVEFFSAKVEK
jgi:beta-galactosidase